MACEKSKYDIWLGKPQSVKERRENFLWKMGFVEGSSALDEYEAMGLERVTESTGAVSSSCGLFDSWDGDNLPFEARGPNSDACFSVDYSDQDWLDDLEETNAKNESVKQCEVNQIQASVEEGGIVDNRTKKAIRWWRHFTQKMKRSQAVKASNESKTFADSRSSIRVRVEQNGKRCVECSAVYAGQEINAHNGLIWTMKFSPDGQYLASGGEDGLVRIWRVGSVDVDSNTEKCRFGGQDVDKKNDSIKKKSSHLSIIIPEKTFFIEEKPVRTFRGHSSDVLDLAWSKSNYLLSSSMDRTVRLWRVDSDECLSVFHHSNYVTCVQFNPVDENYFISGSIDGKIRIWGVTSGRVEDWINAHDIVTTVSYLPSGKGFVVGSVSGVCRFYETSAENELLLNAEINFIGRKKSSGNKITGIQFLKDDPRRVMITSEDSKIRILDGLEVVRKYRGLAKSGTQMSASFTSDGRHIISVGEDSRIYMWNSDDSFIQTSKLAKSIRSFEHFFYEGVSVAIPWTEFHTEQNHGSSNSGMETKNNQDSPSRLWDPERFSLANWFSMDGSSKGSVTWPEEKLPSWDFPSGEQDCKPCNHYGDHHLHQHEVDNHSSRIISSTWGLVFVTANWDGTIRTFHNYGLPTRTPFKF
ncbi:uncharacterized protein [Primulina eburnea]|uniref:uncharacterized protein n=1 Tax=Primulina eburnea TaxID=1245227 RepID=UPI003C6C0F12